ncbi:hypothetical protein Vadar_020434 [Vaccinium darrowii]|uniref:Uncharacterized protein n=1 Tax=Vaccinium darrowii TaxID=229202 RepID=A0ACB7ZD19_9ERIC|nr:hypothetical protein Vadar_020434 [Vaccinium darrowii]
MEVRDCTFPLLLPAFPYLLAPLSFNSRSSSKIDYFVVVVTDRGMTRFCSMGLYSTLQILYCQELLTYPYGEQMV